MSEISNDLTSYASTEEQSSESVAAEANADDVAAFESSLTLEEQEELAEQILQERIDDNFQNFSYLMMKGIYSKVEERVREHRYS